MTNQRWTCSRVAALFVFYVLLLAVQTAFGQDTSATLSGVVADGTGASIPGATLVITNTATKFHLSVTSNSAGEYNFQNLTPGVYSLHVEASGFKVTDQKDIKLDTSQQGRSNVTLTIGSSDQSVEVNAQLPTINYTDPTLSGSIEPEVLQDFPLIVSGAPRSSVSVATMMPGVSTGGGGNAFNARINGGMVSGDEAIVDGATTMEGYMNQSGMVALQTDFGMSPDITSEVTVLGANYDAQYGNTTSGQLVIETRSGSDAFHGAIYEYFRNEDLNAFPYGAAKGSRKPQDRQNDYGAALGGFIPGMHGANKFLRGYFYFNYEGFQERGGANPTTLSIPSLAARSGNFGAFGSQLYYPNDTAKYGALAGTAIPGNVINPAFEDPIAKAYMAALPTPTSNTEFNNYYIPAAGQGSLTAGENVYFGRFDFNIGKKDHAYYTSWWQRTGVNSQSNLPLPISTAEPADPENALIQRLNWEHTFTSTMTNRATLGYLNRNEGYFALAGPTSSAFPGVNGVANTTYKPEFTFGNGYTQLGQNAPPVSTDDKTTRGTWAFNDVLTKVWGHHTVKAGYEWRLAGTAIHLAGNQGGTFGFNADTTGNSLCPNSSCPGDSAASFYLGAVGSASASYYNVHAEYPRQYGNAVHIGDSWRATPKLTVDYSLRWDYIAPFKEKYNHLSFFDPTGSNPGAVTAGGAQLKGRLAFAGTGYGSSSYGADYPEVPFRKAFAPRVGFAYSVNEKTVVRAGYGIYFGQAFYPGWSGGMNLDGFNKNLTLNESAAGAGQIPAIYLSSGISAAQVGPTQNISSAFDNGQAPLYRPLDGNKRPYSQQWNFTIERQLPKSIALTASYVGTKGTHLPSSLNPINVLNPYNSTIQALGSDINVSYNSANGPATFARHGVAVPYVGWQNQLSGCSPTLGQALLAFPQYCSTLTGLNEDHGASIYHSLQLKAERRFTKGVYILSTFTLAKLQTDASDSTQSTNDVSAGNQGNNGSFSPYDTSTRRFALAADNVPAIFQLSLVYELPFGTGRRYMSHGLAGSMLGGFTVSPLYRYEYGTPVSFYSSSCPAQTSTGGESGSGGIFRVFCVPSITGNAYAQGRNGINPGQPLFNRAAFQTSFTSLFDNGGGSAVPNLYGPSFKNWDISIQKNTRIAERVNLKIYANFFNAFNNHYLINSQNGNFSGPNSAFNTDVSNANFGLWNGSVSNPRTIQFAGRVEF